MNNEISPEMRALAFGWTTRQRYDAATIEGLRGERDNARKWAKVWKCVAKLSRANKVRRDLWYQEWVKADKRAESLIPPADAIELFEAAEAAGYLSESGQQWLDRVREATD